MALGLIQIALVLVNFCFAALFPLFSPEYGPNTTTLAIAVYFCAGLLVSTTRPRIWLYMVAILLPLSTDIYRHFSIWVGESYYFNAILTGYFALGSWLGLNLPRLLGVLRYRRPSPFALDLRSNCLFGILFAISIYALSIGKAIDVNMFGSATGATFKGWILHIGNATRLAPNSDFYFLREFQGLASASLLGALMAQAGREHKASFGSIVNTMCFAGISIAIVGIISKFVKFGFYQIHQSAGINSIFPDIHSFASYALMIGILCMYQSIEFKKNKDWYAWGVAILGAGICGYAVYLSGSRFNLVVMGGLIFGGVVWNLARLLRSRKSKIAGAGAALCSILLVTNLFDLKDIKRTGRYDLNTVYSGLASMEFEKVNKTLSFRPEVFRAAFRLTSMYPAFGIGAANFYRYAGEFDLGKSVYLKKVRGENAHNYFLQVLSERGIVGLISFLALIWLVMARKRSDTPKDERIIPVFMAALLLGNIFGHTLLIWYFQVIFWLLFFWTGVQRVEGNTAPATGNWLKLTGIGVAALVALFIADSALVEHKFGYGRFCYKENYWSDNATGGVITEAMARKKKVAKIKPIGPLADPALITNARPGGPAGETAESEGATGMVGKVTADDWQSIPEIPKGGAIYLSRCYIPMHYGENLDQRRLGFRAGSK